MRSLINILFPESCSICRRRLKGNERFLCIQCVLDMPLTYFWKWKDNPAEKRLWGRIYPERVISLYYYRHDDQYSGLIHKIKYGGNPELGKYLGKMLGKKIMESCPEFIEDIDYLIPVPLHPIKKIRRGFNQAEVIAQGISSATGKTLLRKTLIRKIYSRSQTGVAIENKWKNVEGAFALKKGSETCMKLEGAHIVLIDDVLTTGSTMEACNDALKNIKNLRVSLITLSFVG